MHVVPTKQSPNRGPNQHEHRTPRRPRTRTNATGKEEETMRALACGNTHGPPRRPRTRQRRIRYIRWPKQTLTPKRITHAQSAHTRKANTHTSQLPDNLARTRTHKRTGNPHATHRNTHIQPQSEATLGPTDTCASQGARLQLVPGEKRLPPRTLALGRP